MQHTNQLLIRRRFVADKKSSEFIQLMSIFQIEFEHEHEDRIAKDDLPDVYDNATKVVYLGDGDDSTWEIRSKVPSAGRYHVIVKFFQPNHPQFNLIYRINTDKSIYDGKLPLRNCPSISGCRELIKQDNGYSWFDIEEGVTITLTVSRICSCIVDEL